MKPLSVEPPKLELKELPEHLEYAFLQENNQLPVVISSALSVVEKSRLFEVLKNHKGAIAWSIADIKGIESSFYTHKMLMEDEFKPCVQPQRRVNPNIKKVVKKEVINLLDAVLIYPISDSPWVSPVQVIPKKGGMTVVKNEKNELIPQRTVTRCDYAVEAVLGKMIDKNFKPIHYASKKINEAQDNYTTTKKELLAVVFAFYKFRQYFVLSKTIIFTDHSALRYLKRRNFSLKTKKKSSQCLETASGLKPEPSDGRRLSSIEKIQEDFQVNFDKKKLGSFCRKAHLLEDKQIPSVGVFDKVFLALEWHLEEIHATWAHLEKKRTRLRTYAKSLEDLCIQCVETASPRIRTISSLMVHGQLRLQE
ncbi:reverse transcriptase domain-containing protein [Tanacetum coccineum]